MSALPKSSIHFVELTDKAASKLQELLTADGHDQWGLRFGVERGVCGTGYEYRMLLTSHPEVEDEIFSSHGIAIYIPQKSIKKLSGCWIDYKEGVLDERFEDLQRIGFTVTNPNAKGSCPCACDKGFDF